MALNDFKDRIFDILNDADSLEIYDIETDDKRNIFTIATQAGIIFEVECRQIMC